MLSNPHQSARQHLDISRHIDAISAHINDAERCKGQCRDDSPESVSLGHVIRALQAVRTLLRALAPLLPGRK